jgi:hypothetical protein
MSIAPPPAAATPIARFDESVRVEVRSLVARMFPHRMPVERRSNGRNPYPFLLRIVPVANDGQTPTGDAIVVVGRDLSERGMGFFHQQPLMNRYAIATIQDNTGGGISLLLDVSWCRFTSYGWYVSGGRFLRVINSPAVDTQNV